MTATTSEDEYMKSFELVREVGHAVQNIMSFESALNGSAFRNEYNPLSEILTATQSWYAYEYEGDGTTPGGICLAPSKYVGYKHMTPEDYLANNGQDGQLNGRDTENALRPLSIPLLPGDLRYDAAHAALIEKCAIFGKVPNARSRISLLDLGREERLEKEAAQIKALTLLISTLSEEGQSQLKRAAFR
jgi:hypothetical protein